MPNLESDFGVKSDIEAFKAVSLGAQTAVRIISIGQDGKLGDRVLGDEELQKHFEAEATTSTSTIFVNRFLVNKSTEPWPKDASKFRLSPSAFESIRSRFQLSPSFLNALSHLQHASPRSFPRQDAAATVTDVDLDFWVFIPVRVQVQCLDTRAHTMSSKGKSQMNPLNYLHLLDPDVDIRGSKIAMYYRVNPQTGLTSSLVFNSQDGRWKKVVGEPILRPRELYRGDSDSRLGRDPVYLQMAVINSVLRWWNNALNSFNDQLIAYEETLIRQDLTDENLPDINARTNQSLHCMAAHLHRYGSELRSLADILQDMRAYNIQSDGPFVARGFREAGSLGRIMTAFGQAASYMTVISTFREELQQKIDNVLALLVDNTQVMGDRLLVQNSKAMHAILEASKSEAEASRQIALQSQRLSEEMMKDSVAMKTIAVLTAVFLPGTSFAAVLSMPFFDKDDADGNWLKNPDKIWVWFVLTVPSTALCFWVFFSWSKRESARKAAATQDLEMQLQNPTCTALPLAP